jgi:hypothetical protein
VINTSCHPRESGDLVTTDAEIQNSRAVNLISTGIVYWVPAFAGMTGLWIGERRCSP